MVTPGCCQVAHDPQDADAGHEDKLEEIFFFSFKGKYEMIARYRQSKSYKEILDPSDLIITLASSLPTAVRMGNGKLYGWKIDVNNWIVSHFNYFLLLYFSILHNA